jgi:hypothetical protein
MRSARGIGVVDHQRLAAGIGRGRDDDEVVGGMPRDRPLRPTRRLPEDQVMKRRRRRHHPEPPEARRDRGRHRAGDRLHHHDRRRRGDEEIALDRPRMDDPIERGDVGDHHRERLGVARLAATQLRDHRLVACITHEMEATEPLHGDDLPRPDRRDDLRHRMRQLRPADATGDRLRMEPTIARIPIGLGAGRAHRKAGHRRLRPVVGQTRGDRVARAAMGAVDEGIEMKPARRIEEIVETGLAGRGVRRHPRRHFAGDALLDAEARPAAHRQRRRLDRVEPGERRPLRRERGDETLGIAPLDLDQHPLGVVQHPPGEPEPSREPKDEGAHADPLDRAANPDPEAPRRAVAEAVGLGRRRRSRVFGGFEQAIEGHRRRLQAGRRASAARFSTQA